MSEGEKCGRMESGQSEGSPPPPCGRTPRGTMSTRSQLATAVPRRAPTTSPASERPTALPGGRGGQEGKE